MSDQDIYNEINYQTQDGNNTGHIETIFDIANFYISTYNMTIAEAVAEAILDAQNKD